MIGRRLAHYEILEQIGAGGMGEVYRARDTRLDRTVAIKILPAQSCESSELRQRFEREARVISHLSHPYICVLHDVGHEDGIDFLVMEYLDGETVAQRLRRGPLPLDQVLRYGAQIAEGLETAHRQGVIHRDLKPGNIMLTESGVKILDFGLAKLAPPSGEVQATITATEPGSEEPLTRKGAILGTLRYMAPEQLEGMEADTRTDIFALGSVIYEMATGRRAFEGKSQASLIAAILEREPAPVSSIQPMTPSALDWTVRKCLSKDPEDRWQSATDVASELKWIAEDSSRAGVAAPVLSRSRNRERLAWTIAATVSLALAAVTAALLRHSQPEPATMRFSIPSPEAVSVVDLPRISPDGRFLAFAAGDPGGEWSIWLRPLDELTARPLPGTEDAGRPFWSPDSRFLGFFAEGKLRKIPVSGGPVQTICDASGADGAWGSGGIILFDGGRTDSIRQVPAAGGVPRAATNIDRSRGEIYHAWPEFLPDGRHFTYLAVTQGSGTGTVMLGALDSETTKALATGTTRAEYAPPGYLVFVRDGILMAQPFDDQSLEVTGEAFPVIEGVGVYDPHNLAHFSLSKNGILIYLAAGAGTSRLVWVDRAGREVETVGEPAAYRNPTLSPDGKRIAVTMRDRREGTDDIWVLQPERDIISRFTFDSADESAPVWSPDGSQIVFASSRGGEYDLFTKPAGGAVGLDTLLVSELAKFPVDWSRDGRFISFMVVEQGLGWNVYVLPTDGDGQPIPVLTAPHVEAHPRFSPDGRWLAYSSNESGRPQIYVQDFPGASGKWQVSNQGGMEPQWRGDGRELFYLAPDLSLMSVETRADSIFEAGVPQRLFEAAVSSDIVTLRRYVAAADGEHFLLVSPLGQPTQSTTTVVVNWTQELRR